MTKQLDNQDWKKKFNKEFAFELCRQCKEIWQGDVKACVHQWPENVTDFIEELLSAKDTEAQQEKLKDKERLLEGVDELLRNIDPRSSGHIQIGETSSLLAIKELINKIL